MTFGSLIIEGRAAAETLMVDTCRVSFRSSLTVQDETTGKELPVYTERFTSRCKVQGWQVVATSSRSDVGGRVETSGHLAIHFPFDCPQPAVGDVVEMLTTGPGSDPRLIGRKFLIQVPANKTFATATRVDVVEIEA